LNRGLRLFLPISSSSTQKKLLIYQDLDKFFWLPTNSIGAETLFAVAFFLLDLTTSSVFLKGRQHLVAN
jgi:hypothetical protein